MPVEHIISCHTGTVLAVDEPPPSITVEEEGRATRIFEEAVRSGGKGGSRRQSKQQAKNMPPNLEAGEDAIGQDAQEALVDDEAMNDKTEDGGGEIDQEPASSATNDEVDGATSPDGVGNDDVGEITDDLPGNTDSLPPLNNPPSGKGLSLSGVRDALYEFGIDFDADEELFDRHVRSFLQARGLLTSDADDFEDDSFLDLEGFLEVVAHVYAPAHKFGARLRKACARADEKVVGELLARGCNPLGTDGGGFSSLHYAAQHGQCEGIVKLLDFAKKPPPFMVAEIEALVAAADTADSGINADAAFQEVSVVGGGSIAPTNCDDDDKARENGAAREDPAVADDAMSQHSRQSHETTSKHEVSSALASESGDGDITGEGLCAEEKDSEHPAQPRFFSVNRTYEKCMLEARDNSSWTPLMVAAACGKKDALAALIGAGADMSACSYTPLRPSRPGDKQEKVGSRHSTSANMMGRGGGELLGRTALHWACAKGRASCVTELLQAAGTSNSLDVNATDASGWTPLHCAFFHGHIAVAEVLVKKFRAARDAVDRLGRTPLDCTCFLARSEFASLYLFVTLLACAFYRTDADEEATKRFNEALAPPKKRMSQISAS